MVPTDVLIALFSGDEVSPAHPTVALASRLCERLQPVSLRAFRELLFGAVPADLVDQIQLDVRVAMREGFAAWNDAGRPSERRDAA